MPVVAVASASSSYSGKNSRPEYEVTGPAGLRAIQTSKSAQAPAPAPPQQEEPLSPTSVGYNLHPKYNGLFNPFDSDPISFLTQSSSHSPVASPTSTVPSNGVSIDVNAFRFDPFREDLSKSGGIPSATDPKVSKYFAGQEEIRKPPLQESLRTLLPNVNVGFAPNRSFDPSLVYTLQQGQLQQQLMAAQQGRLAAAQQQIMIQGQVRNLPPHLMHAQQQSILRPPVQGSPNPDEFFGQFLRDAQAKQHMVANTPPAAPPASGQLEPQGQVPFQDPAIMAVSMGGYGRPVLSTVQNTAAAREVNAEKGRLKVFENVADQASGQTGKLGGQ
jgi:hypothetical protein